MLITSSDIISSFIHCIAIMATYAYTYTRTLCATNKYSIFVAPFFSSFSCDCYKIKYWFNLIALKIFLDFSHFHFSVFTFSLFFGNISISNTYIQDERLYTSTGIKWKRLFISIMLTIIKKNFVIYNSQSRTGIIYIIINKRI